MAEILATPNEDALLQNCPRRGYSLRGLPMVHDCPECALPFDRNWVVFGGPHGRKAPQQMALGMRGFVVGILLAAVALLVGVGLLVRGVSLFFRPSTETLLLAIGAIDLGIVLFVLRARPRCAVILDYDGVRVMRRKRTVCVAWPNVSSAKHMTFHKQIRIETRGLASDKPVSITVWELCPFDLATADLCAKTIRERAEREHATAQAIESSRDRPAVSS